MLKKKTRHVTFNEVKELLKNEKVQYMKNFNQHGNTSTYKHCINVAKISYYISKKLKIKIDYNTLLKGAILHDFYLYDWHKIGSGPLKLNELHGFSHSKKSALNAVYYLNIDKDVENIIISHMWPLTVKDIPKSKEAWIVCAADKIATIYEFFNRK